MSAPAGEGRRAQGGRPHHQTRRRGLLVGRCTSPSPSEGGQSNWGGGKGGGGGGSFKRRRPFCFPFFPWVHDFQGASLLRLHAPSPGSNLPSAAAFRAWRRSRSRRRHPCIARGGFVSPSIIGAKRAGKFRVSHYAPRLAARFGPVGRTGKEGPEHRAGPPRSQRYDRRGGRKKDPLCTGRRQAGGVHDKQISLVLPPAPFCCRTLRWEGCGGGIDGTRKKLMVGA